MALLRRHFEFTDDAELSIEVDPRTVNPARLQHLRALGFNGLSFGVQNFNAAVQKALYHEQSTAQVFELVSVARELQFDSINAGLIYGLPQQSPASFQQTLDTLVALLPDRVALQALALHRLSEADYVDIGMDHFASPRGPPGCSQAQGLAAPQFPGL